MRNILAEIQALETKMATEGPRGEIIGKTQSGKPIYDTHSHPAHKDFTDADHGDAMRAHADKMVEAKNDKRKRSMELAKNFKGDFVKAVDADPEYQTLDKKEKHHSKSIDHHSGLFPKDW